MTLEKTLLTSKINDYEKYSTAMPLNAKLLSKGFANAIGTCSGKVLLAYDSMLTNIANNTPIDKTASECTKILDKESKIKFMNFDARLCSLVALNHSGFMTAETNLYSQLMKDLNGKELNKDNINYELRSIGISNSDTYEKLLANKTQSIYDFGVLMGTNKDNVRFDTITKNMPKTLKTYFTNVVKLHTGNKLFSWPIPFRKYSGVISDMLYNDSTSYALQDSIDKDIKFKNPELNNNRYEVLRNEINNVLKEKTFKNKMQAAKFLPAAALYMSGLNAYAENISTNVDKDEKYLGAVTTAGITAYTCAKDGKGNIDASAFSTTFITAFTSTMG